MRGTFSCLLSCARGMKPQRKQTDVKDVQMVLTSQKMEQVKNTRGSAPDLAPFSTTSERLENVLRPPAGRQKLLWREIPPSCMN